MLAEVDAHIERYLKQLAHADYQTPKDDKTQRLEDKIAALKEEMSRLKKLESRMLEAPDKQLSLTDPDARSMNSRGTGIVGYNVQTAVDTEHHLVVAHEVTNVGTDRRQLANMAKRAKEALARDRLKVVADRGYYRSEEFVACEDANITAYVPNSATSNNQAKGLFGRDRFIYIEADDEFECPAGERLRRRTSMQDRGLLYYRYWADVCESCDLKKQCTMGSERRVSRWEHDHLLRANDARLENEPEAMAKRRATVEHPFGTLKAWMGATHFLTRTLDRVSTEMSLHVLAYNMKRVIRIVGVRPLIEAIQD